MSSERTTYATLRLVLLVLAFVVLAPVLMVLVAFPMMGMWGGMMGGFGGAEFSPAWAVAMMLVWLVVIVGGGYLVYGWVSRNGGFVTDPALEELRVAYARGEITEAEYEERRAKLRGE